MKKLKFLTLFLTLIFALSIPITSFAMDVTFTDPTTNKYPAEYQDLIKNAPSFKHLQGFFISADTQTDEIFATGSDSGSQFMYAEKHKVIVDNIHTVVYVTATNNYLYKLNTTSNTWDSIGNVNRSDVAIYGSSWVRDNLDYVIKTLKLGSGSHYCGNVPVSKPCLNAVPGDQAFNDELESFFPKLPVTVLGPILAPIQMDPLKEIISLLSLLIPLLIGLIGLRKGLSFLQQKLRQA